MCEKEREREREMGCGWCVCLWRRMQHVLMTARAAWSCTSPSLRRRRIRGCKPFAATIRFDSTGPVAACAAIAAAARVCACGLPRVRIVSISSKLSEPLKSSFAGVGGGFDFGLFDGVGAAGADDFAGAGAADAARPPRPRRSSAAARTPSDILVCALVEREDSRRTISTTPSGRGVGSTHTPLSFWHHHRLWPTKVSSPSSW